MIGSASLRPAQVRFKVRKRFIDDQPAITLAQATMRCVDFIRFESPPVRVIRIADHHGVSRVGLGQRIGGFEHFASCGTPDARMIAIARRQDGNAPRCDDGGQQPDQQFASGGRQNRVFGRFEGRRHGFGAASVVLLGG